MKSTCLDLYQKVYVDQQFERAGLFRAVQQKYGGTTVLYPGCFVHVTPSFFFPHVVYVDRMEDAAQFFSAESEILAFIQRHKMYKRAAYVQFLAMDYLQPLPLPDNGFDVLIALYAGGVTRACQRYLRPGGLVLTNNHHADAAQAAADPALALVAAVYQKGQTFTIREDGLDAYFTPCGSTADAYIFQKTAPRRASGLASSHRTGQGMNESSENGGR